MRTFSRLILACTVFAPLAASAAQVTEDLTVTAEVKASCRVDAATIDFGVIDTTDPAGPTASGAINVTCTAQTPATITLDDGLHSDASGRRMADADGNNHLRYELYGDVGLTQRFGEAAPDYVADVVGTGSVQTVNVYGKIADNQTTVPAGSYSDTVTIVVTF